MLSHSSRGAWIEIYAYSATGTVDVGRTPHGVRGLKLLPIFGGIFNICRTPHGVRGLKYPQTKPEIDGPLSHSSRGAWIEIYLHSNMSLDTLSHSSRGAWIEISPGAIFTPS